MEEKMRKVILFSIAIAAMFCVSTFAAPKKVALKVWESAGPEKTFMNAAIKAFKKVDPTITIKYEPVEATDARSKIELDGPAGVGADVFVTPHDHIGALVQGGHVLPIDDAETYMKDFLPMAKTAATYNGKIYGYPLGAETYVLFYNKDIIPNAPKTWEEVITFAKTFNSPAESKYALVWPVGDAYFGYMFFASFGAPLFGPEGNDRKQHNLNTPAAIKGLTYFQSLRANLLDIPSADASGDFCNAEFTEKKAAMVITGPWKTNDFKKSGVKFGMTLLPAFPGTDHPANSFSGVRLAYVSSYSQFPDQAKKFAKFITSKEMLQERYRITDQIPPRKDINTKGEYSDAVLQQLKYANPMPTIPQLGTYWNSMGSGFAEIWDGGDVATALNSAAAQMEAAK